VTAPKALPEATEPKTLPPTTIRQLPPVLESHRRAVPGRGRDGIVPQSYEDAPMPPEPKGEKAEQVEDESPESGEDESPEPGDDDSPATLPEDHSASPVPLIRLP
jgi:hypothetical protein